MSKLLDWHAANGRLALSGKLSHETLLPLWQQREVLMTAITQLDLSQLEQVDTAGLALLVHLHEAANRQGIMLRVTGISDKLRSLISLYNLQSLMTVE